jgi:hypothetical protein
MHIIMVLYMLVYISVLLCVLLCGVVNAECCLVDFILYDKIKITIQFYIFYKFKCFITYFWDKCVLRNFKHAMWSVVACYAPEDGLRTETRVGECSDIDKNYKIVYVCAFVGYWIISENAG